jgi:hypothetical protein
MKRTTAYELLNTTDRNVVSKMLGLSRSSVDHWPDELPRAVADRVIAAKIRLEWRAFLELRPHLRPPPIVADALHVATETEAANA